jgi:hypothetical protein
MWVKGEHQAFGTVDKSGNAPPVITFSNVGHKRFQAYALAVVDYVQTWVEVFGRHVAPCGGVRSYDKDAQRIHLPLAGRKRFPSGRWGNSESYIRCNSSLLFLLSTIGRSIKSWFVARL